MTKNNHLSMRENLNLLRGKRVIILRAMDQSKELAEYLSSLGASVILCPVIELVPEESALNEVNEDFINNFDTLIFTSSNGVKIFMNSLIKKNIGIKIINTKKILVIGPKTKETAIEFGIHVDAMPKTYVAESIIECFEKELDQSKILIATSIDARSIIPDELRKRGAFVKVLSIYKNISPPLADIKILDNDFVVFTSSSTANHFFQSKLYIKQKIKAFCIGEITAATVKKYIDSNIYTAKEATALSIASCISQHVKNENK